MNKDFPPKSFGPLGDDPTERAVLYERLGISLEPPSKSLHSTIMSDERQRLEDRIAAAEERMQLRMEAAQARADGRLEAALARIDGRFETIGTRLDGIEKATSGTKLVIITTGIAVVGLVVAVLTFGQAWFGIGLTTRDVIRATVTEMRPATTP